MKEIRAIISGYNKIQGTKIHAALATVVKVEGSSYRRAGARMLVMDNGNWIGGISGGCLEGDALKRARLAITKSVSSLITYDTTEDDAHQIGVGLGCNGIIDVLFTPLDFQNKNNPVEILKCCVEDMRKTHVLITVTFLEGTWQNVNAGDAIMYKKSGDLKLFNDDLLEKDLSEKINQQIENGKSSPHNFVLSNDRKISVFVEILLPEIHLVLMGNQYDIYPLARLIKEIGWLSTIVSNPLKVNAEIAKIVDNVIGNDRLNDIVIDKYSAIILMSHDYKTDKINLPKALATRASYIGMLGPKVRAEKIFNALENEGHPITSDDKDRVYAPAGLDIGALSPEEIALSLIAEIRAVFSKRQGNFLRLRQSTIHERN